jgi:hypothetical protein
MLSKFARQFVYLGEEIEQARAVFEMAEALSDPGDPGRQLDNGEKEHLAGVLSKILEVCVDLNLEVSKDVFTKAVDDLPTTAREYRILTDVLYADMANKLFIFVPPHRRKYFQPRHFVAENTKATFPKARAELADGGRCHAVGQHTAAVFHSMRAVELGLRAVAAELDVQSSFSIELADQESVIRGIETKIKALKDTAKGDQKDEEQKFYAEASIQFREFKDAWRNRVSHTRASYSEAQAADVLDHVAKFLSVLATRLKEPNA